MTVTLALSGTKDTVTPSRMGVVGSRLDHAERWVEPRRDIVAELRHQLQREQITGKLIHLCFTCDPYPVGRDTTATRQVIQALKEYGNHVQILTKGDGSRDLDLLDDGDWYGATFSSFWETAMEAEPGAIAAKCRIEALLKAKQRGIRTWVSFEPVLDPVAVVECIKLWGNIFDKIKIGKLNYHHVDINWPEFGRKAEALCQEMGLDYYIKDSLRAEMEKA